MEVARTRYVLGFMFNLDMTELVLIRKQRPDWQKGLLNGVGGHIEGYESPLTAMVREFKEEANGEHDSTWVEFGILEGPDWVVHCFKSTLPNFKGLSTITDEDLVFIRVEDLSHYSTVDNLQWIIPMAIKGLTFNITYP